MAPYLIWRVTARVNDWYVSWDYFTPSASCGKKKPMDDLVKASMFDSINGVYEYA